MEARESLEALLLAEQGSGFFTDFYVEAGRLDESAPRYHFGNGHSLFDLASLTKALVTGPLVHSFASKQGLSLSESIGNWPSFDNAPPFSKDILDLTAQELLAHRSGLPSWRNFWMNHLNEGPLPKAVRMNPIIPDTFARLNGLGPKIDLYSDLGYILLGFFLEYATGVILSENWARYLTKLSMPINDLGFAPQLSAPSNAFIASAACAVRSRLLQGEVHDENCAALGGIAGHAGLFGKGPAVGAYLRSLYHSNEGLAYLTHNQRELPLHSFEGLSGLRRGSGTSAALFAEGKGLGHLGFVGTAFWLDLPSKRYAIFLSNRVISGRVNPHITPVRREVFGYLNDLA